MDTEQRVRVRVSGRVQGVFFRASLRQQAHRLDLSGWARNTRDGQVEAEFQGGAEAVREAVSFCHKGPDQADVADVDVEDIDTVPGETGFKIR